MFATSGSMFFELSPVTNAWCAYLATRESAFTKLIIIARTYFFKSLYWHMAAYEKMRL